MITYIVTTIDGYTVPSACFNPSLLQPLNGLCEAPNTFVASTPVSEATSLIDLRGTYLQADLIQDNFGALITSALQRAGFSNTGMSSMLCSVYFLMIQNNTMTEIINFTSFLIIEKNQILRRKYITVHIYVICLVSSILTEPRFGLDISLITRVYYTVLPSLSIPQEQIQSQLRVSLNQIPFTQHHLYVQSIFAMSQPLKYDLYASGQLSVLRTDAHQYIANVSMPLTTATRQEIETYLTSFNRRTLTSSHISTE